MVVKFTFYNGSEVYQIKLVFNSASYTSFLHKILNSWMLKFLISFYSKNQLNEKLKLIKL
jgi:hypothetical protein